MEGKGPSEPELKMAAKQKKSDVMLLKKTLHNFQI